MELETVNHVRFVTDSNGWVAIDQPNWVREKIFFQVHSHGYEFRKDGFGFAGVAIDYQPGKSVVLKMKRDNVAQRLYRITGRGIYRDSLLLGQPSCPLAHPAGTGKVAGQDSAMAVVYRNKIHWFWGDTDRMRYPLGQFWTSGAVSELPQSGGLNPAHGIDLDYFVGDDGFSRPMARLGVKNGPIWIDAPASFLTARNTSDWFAIMLTCSHSAKCLIMESLSIMTTRIALNHSRNSIWTSCGSIPDKRIPSTTATTAPSTSIWARCFRQSACQRHWIIFRQRPMWKLGPVWRREAMLPIPSSFGLATGDLSCAWRKSAPPADIKAQWRWLSQDKITFADTCFIPLDCDTGKPVQLHRGSIAWNEYRHKWIMIAAQTGGTSMLGEIWYAESPALTGPWQRAKKIVTHDKYSFYNPVHHPFFDQDHGRLIYFEGTYTTTFSGNTDPTPRYNYNQIMYQLDLDDPRLTPTHDQ